MPTAVPIAVAAVATTSAADTPIAADAPIAARAPDLAERAGPDTVPLPDDRIREARPRRRRRRAAAALAARHRAPWLVGGNTIVKAGVAILFVGLAFLAKYAAEHTDVPVELRLAASAPRRSSCSGSAGACACRGPAMRRCCRAARSRCST